MYKIMSLLLCFLTTGYSLDITINRSIRIADGEKKSGDLITVNGSIYIGDDSKITGTCRSVNGKIRIGSNSKVKRLQTVNGSIDVAEYSYVGSDIESVNGPVTSEKGVFIRGSVETVNGPIELDETTVHKDITTYNGTIILDNKSIVERNIIIKESRGRNRRRKPLDIFIKNGSVVEGDIVVKQEDFEVIVHLENGKVKGDITGATVEKD